MERQFQYEVAQHEEDKRERQAQRSMLLDEIGLYTDVLNVSQAVGEEPPPEAARGLEKSVEQYGGREEAARGVAQRASKGG